MTEPPELDEAPVPAGGFSAWLAGMQRALAGEAGSDVPCGTCTACCTSAQFIHVGPDETDTLARIPAELLFPAPGMPPGHNVLGYDAEGRCPMLIDDACSIYADRPRTCRTYDCRVFPATGVEVDDERQVHIARRAGRWHFDIAGDDDRARHDAVRAAAASIRDHPERLPDGAPAPADATQHAVLAIRMHEAFLAPS